MAENPSFPCGATFNGPLACTQLFATTPSVDNAMVKSDAAIAATKLQHQFENCLSLNGNASTNAAAVRQVIHVVKGATATIIEMSVGAITAATVDATATITLKKNGSVILTASITLDASTAAFIFKNPAGYTSTALVAGDVLEVEITAVSAGAGALAKGVFARLTVREDA